jgi:hypothetical protein
VHRVVKTSRHPLANGMFRSGSAFLDGGKLSEVFDQMGLEVLAMAAMNPGWETIIYYKILKGNLCNVFAVWFLVGYA